jgi:hypothetical protein
MFIIHFLVDGASPTSSTRSDAYSMPLDIPEFILIVVVRRAPRAASAPAAAGLPCAGHVSSCSASVAASQRS